MKLSSRTLQCDQCGRWVKTKESLDRHINLYHTPSGKKYKCKKCGKELGNKAAMYSHNHAQGPSSFEAHQAKQTKHIG